MENKIGIKIGDYVIVALKGIFNQKRVYIAECSVCKNRKELQFADFARKKNLHCVKNCLDNYMKLEIGKQFGDFIVESYTKDWKYNCRCTICGKRKTLIYNELHNLKRVSHKLCSNGDNDMSKEWKKFHSIWSSMRNRTANPKAVHFKDYGGRGILSDDYKLFMDFKNDFYDEFLSAVKIYGLKEISIDRIDNNKSYTKNNIRFTDKRTQAINTRRIKNIIATSPTGEIFHFRVIKDFAEKHDLCRSCITLCLKGVQSEHKGWTFKYK